MENKHGRQWYISSLPSLYVYFDQSSTKQILLVQVIRGLDQGILGGEGVPPMQVGMDLMTTDVFLFFYVLCNDYYLHGMITLPMFPFTGGKRKLQIPPHLAYGPEPAGCFSGEYQI